MRYKWFAALTAAVMLTGMLSGCGKQEDKRSPKEEPPVMNYYMPTEGEEIVRISIKDYGDVTVKLFPELLPEACENFKELAKSGYYDELIFHRVMEDFMIQGGDPRGDGTGGESIWGGSFDGGYSEYLIHVPGALAYANSGGTATDGSQFYIVTGEPEDEEKLKTITAQSGVQFSLAAKELYCQYGGAPWLDGGNYTVFGQVIDGLDVVYAVSHVPVNENNKPKKAVYIEKMSVEQYDGSAVRHYKTDYAGLE